MIGLNDVRLADVMPDSLTRDSGASSAASAIDAMLKEAAAMVETPAIYVAIDSLPEAVLDHLATQYDASVWRDTWPASLKRSVLKTTIADKRMKGSVRAVRQALASVSSVAIIKEWWEQSPKGTPHTFAVIASQGDVADTISAEMQEDIAALIDDAKPLRSHYTLSIQNNLAAGISASSHLRAAVASQISPAPAETFKVETTFAVLAGLRAILKRHIVFDA